MSKLVVAITAPEIVNVLEVTPVNLYHPGKPTIGVTAPGPVKTGVKPVSKLRISISSIGPLKEYSIGTIGSPVQASCGDGVPPIRVNIGCGSTSIVTTFE